MVNVQSKAFLKKALKNQQETIRDLERKLKMEKKSLSFIKKQLVKAK